MCGGHFDIVCQFPSMRGTAVPKYTSKPSMLLLKMKVSRGTDEFFQVFQASQASLDCILLDVSRRVCTASVYGISQGEGVSRAVRSQMDIPRSVGTFFSRNSLLNSRGWASRNCTR